jgi:PTH1 family peptidyl-tRNA hydrolase
MWLIAGLGNPGRRYVNNRHNVGFRCVERIARDHGIRIDARRLRSRIGTGDIDGSKVVLAKPATFMNLSGEAVAGIMRRYRIPPANLLLVYDDLDLPLGRIRIRERGSAGGHKGMKSVIARVQSQEFARIRVGIAPAAPDPTAASDRPDAVKYVLTDFSSREKRVMRDVYPVVAEAVRCLITEGPAAAMNKFN